MAALAAALSMVKIIHMPFGGSVTLLSMLPIMIFGLRRGFPWSIICSTLFAFIQLALDFGEVMTWGLTVPMIIACFILDYILAYSVLGVVGLFSKKSLKMQVGGILIALFARFLVHFISGVFLWHSAGELWSGFPADNEFLYSFVYNGFYMFPEMIFTAAAAFALYKVPQTKALLQPNT